MPYGLLSPELEQLLAGFGATEDDRKAANKQALMTLGFGLLGGRKGQELQTLSNAGMNAMDVRQQYLGGIPRQKLQALEGASTALGLTDKLRSQKDMSDYQEYLRNQANPTGPQQLPQMPSGPPMRGDAGGMSALPPPGSLPPQQQAPATDPYMQLMAKAAQADAFAQQTGNQAAAAQATHLREQALKWREKMDKPQVVMVNGKPVYQRFGEYGGQQTVQGADVPPEISYQDTGGGISVRDKLRETPGALIPKTMSFADKNSSGQLSLAQSKFAYEKQKDAAAGAGEPSWVNDLDRGIQINPKTGQSRPITAEGAPIGQKPKAAPEAYSSQVAGIENLSSAMTDYKKKLKSWSNTDLLKPDKRADMSTAYTDMLMQAKEAYRLGVLNGPDYELLTSVITDPVSTTGAVVSTKAMEKQVNQMMDKMETRKRNLANVYKQPYTNSGGASGGWSAVEVK